MDFPLRLLMLAFIGYVIPTAMPSGRWLAGVSVLIGGPLAALWLQHLYAAAQPGYKEGPGGFLGIAIFLSFAVPFAWGAIMRIVTLASSRSQLPTLAIHTAGFAALIAVPSAIQAWDKWQHRPPSEACAKATFNIHVAQLGLKLPASPFFIIFPEHSPLTNLHNLGLPTVLRDFCAKTDDGREPLRAANIWIKFDP